MTIQLPRRGQIWEIAPQPGKSKWVFVLSADPYNAGSASTVIVMYVTEQRLIREHHLQVNPLDSDLAMPVYIECDQITSMQKNLLSRHIAQIKPQKVREVEDMLRDVLDLPRYRRLPWKLWS